MTGNYAAGIVTTLIPDPPPIFDGPLARWVGIENPYIIDNPLSGDDLLRYAGNDNKYCHDGPATFLGSTLGVVPIAIAIGGVGRGATRPVRGSVGDDLVRAACSFSGTTTVVMANGERRPISEIREGDMVLATDPETGETGAREVIATLPHIDQLLALKTSAGDIITTEDHRYWNETDQQWQESQHLDAGDRLLTADGDEVTVEGLDWTTVHTASAHDLDIADIDTFYVGAGDEDVLVHNSGLDCLGLGLKADGTTGSLILDGAIPSRDAVRRMNPLDRVELEDILETSIANRRADQVSGVFPDPAGNPLHGVHVERIAEEESLLEFIRSLG